MPPSLREWLPEDHLAWFVIDAVDGDRSGGVLCRLSRRRAGPGGARSGDDGGAVALRLRDRRAVVAADRAALRRGRRVPRDRGQPGARSHDDRAVPSAPRGARWPSCSARCWRSAPRPGWCDVGVIAVDGTKVHANASAARDARLRADRARDPRRGRRGRRAPRTSASASARGDELPPELVDRRRAGAAGCARPSAGSMSSAPRRRGRSRASRPERLKEAKRRLEEELVDRVPRQRGL